MSLQEVFVKELRDLYSAENQLVKALPKMAKGASSKPVKDLFNEHLEQTKGQIERLKQAFAQLNKKPTGEHCNGMEGLVEEANEQIQDEDTEGVLKDVGIAGAALRVEHYEIAGYTAAIAIGRELGEKEVIALLTENLNEEKETAKKIQDQSKPLLKAASEQDDEEDEEPEDEDADEDDLEDADDLDDEDEDDDLDDEDDDLEDDDEDEDEAPPPPPAHAKKSAGPAPARRR